MRSPVRSPSQLPESLHHRLNAYALAASVAGVGALALAQPAQAKIVYTKTHLDCSNQPCELNFTGQQRRSFQVSGGSADATSSGFVAGSGVDAPRGYPMYGIAVPEDTASLENAAALPAGVSVGPRTRFEGKRQAGIWGVSWRNGRGADFFGEWANGGKGLKNHYLGFRFGNGQADSTHYGWARVSTSPYGDYTLQTIITGYAYETIPNKPIITGKTHGKDATLGRLAQGASGVATWRQKQ